MVTLTLAATLEEVVSFYVRKREEYALPGVEPGSYDVWVRKGLSWNDVEEDFNLPESYGKFGRPVQFAQIETPGGVTHFDGASLTLHMVHSGNMHLYDRDKNSMPIVGARHT